MNVCRICLSCSIEKDLRQLTSNDETCKSFLDVFIFCLNIQIDADLDVTTKLCLMCFDNLSHFYKFKCLALKSDTQLKSSILPEPEVFIKDSLPHEVKSDSFVNLVIKLEEPHLDENGCLDIQEKRENIGDIVKEEVSDKESEFEDLSDNEFLSSFKQTKNENGAEKDTEENAIVNKGIIKKPPQKAGQKGRVCEECGKTVNNMQRHRQLHQPKGVREQYECEECDRTFLTPSGKTAHYKLKHLNQKKECTVCNKKVVDLRQHTLMKHAQSSMRQECALCKRRFLRKAHLQTHMLSHTKDRPFQCDLCPSNFTTKVAMMRHKQVLHNNEKPFMCQFCSKRFLLKAQLQIHIRSHTNERPFECAECSKNFSDPYTYKKHIKLHSSARVACTLCKKSLSVTSLKSHMKSHTKETPYECRYCGSKFTRSHHRQRHEKNIHQKKMLDGTGKLCDKDGTTGKAEK